MAREASRGAERPEPSPAETHLLAEGIEVVLGSIREDEGPPTKAIMLVVRVPGLQRGIAIQIGQPTDVDRFIAMMEAMKSALQAELS